VDLGGRRRCREDGGRVCPVRFFPLLVDIAVSVQGDGRPASLGGSGTSEGAGTRVQVDLCDL
jgi:hypothetical protein